MTERLTKSCVSKATVAFQKERHRLCSSTRLPELTDLTDFARLIMQSICQTLTLLSKEFRVKTAYTVEKSLTASTSLTLLVKELAKIKLLKL